MKLTDIRTAAASMLPAFGSGNAILTAGTVDRCNPMTIGWFQTGRLWNLPTCSVYVRLERYTYQFMEENEYFTVSVLPASMKRAMTVCGFKSGRDVDKIKECGLTIRSAECGAPFFEEAELVLVCKKLYVQDMDPAAVCPAGEETILPFYGPEDGWHRIYIGNIVEAYTKE